MATLYDLLGMPEDASKEDCERAYRKRARRAHPDSGGSHYAMAELNRAIAVLTDDDKRQRYDAFGDEGRDVEHTQDKITRTMLIVSAIFRAAITIIVGKGGSPKQENVASHMLDGLKEICGEIEKTIVALKRTEKEVEACIDRFEIAIPLVGEQGTEEQQMLDKMIRVSLRQIKQQVLEFERNLESHKGAMEFVKRLKFRKDKRVTSSYNQYGGFTIPAVRFFGET